MAGEERTLLPDDEVERPSRAGQEEFLAQEEAPRPSVELAPLVEVFRAQLIPCLEECRAGRAGLFFDAGPGIWPEAEKLRELAFALQQVHAQQDERSPLIDEFLDLCTIHGESNPGEPRLARQFLDRIDKAQVGSPTEAPPPWMKPEAKP